MPDNYFDFSSLQTTRNRPYDADNLNYIYGRLKERGYDDKHIAVLLGTIAEESGGDPYAVSPDGKFQGLLQWAGDRYAINPFMGENPKRELDRQIDYIARTIDNLDDSKSWTHGGKGSGYNRAADAHEAYVSSDSLDAINHAFNRGYVRPTGGDDSVANRYKVAEQVYNIISNQQPMSMGRPEPTAQPPLKEAAVVRPKSFTVPYGLQMPQAEEPQRFYDMDMQGNVYGDGGRYPTSTTKAQLSGAIDYLLRRGQPKSFTQSKYRPTVGDDGETYYTREGLKNEVALNLFGGTDYGAKDNLGTDVFYRDFDDAYNQISGSTTYQRDLRHASNGTLGQYAVTTGSDDRGRYLSFVDKFDYVLLPGKPIHIYDRIYEDEVNDIYNPNDSAIEVGDMLSRSPYLKGLRVGLEEPQPFYDVAPINQFATGGRFADGGQKVSDVWEQRTGVSWGDVGDYYKQYDRSAKNNMLLLEQLNAGEWDYLMKEQKMRKAAQAMPYTFETPKDLTKQQVKEVQKFLSNSGYDIGKWGADGDFGEQTTKAYQQYLMDAGISVGRTGADGDFGANTRRGSMALMNAANGMNSARAASYYDMAIDDAFNRILKFENSKNNKNGGWDSKRGVWRPHNSPEGGAKTIAYGIKLTNGTKWAKLAKQQGYLTDAQALQAAREMTADYYARAKKTFDGKYGKGAWDALNWKQQSILVDYEYNVKGGIASFPSLMRAMRTGDIAAMKKHYKRYYGKNKPLTSRNAAIYADLNMLGNKYPVTAHKLAEGGDVDDVAYAGMITPAVKMAYAPDIYSSQGKAAARNMAEAIAAGQYKIQNTPMSYRNYISGELAGMPVTRAIGNAGDRLWRGSGESLDSGALGFVPVVGDALQAGQAVKDASQGNYLAAALGAGMLVLPDVVAKPIKKAAEKAYEIANLGGGYMLKPFMRGNPLEQQISKQGTVNVNNIRALANKGNKMEQDVVDRVLASEEFADSKNVDYNKFRKAVQDELITYDRVPSTEYEVYGMDKIGFEPIEVSDGNGGKIAYVPDVGTRTYTFTSPRIDRGHNKHYDLSTLGHSRTYTTKDEPDVLHVMESQSDWAQQSNNLTKKEKLRLKNIDESIAAVTGDNFDPDWQDEIPKWEAERQRIFNDLANRRPKTTEEAYLRDNYTSRQILENLRIAAERGQAKMRYPTRETSARIEDYVKNSDGVWMTKDGDINKAETVLRKYDAFPKQYQKLFSGANVRTVTDPKGNTWYEVDVPENYLSQEWQYKYGGNLK